MAIAFDTSSVGTLANPATGITVSITPSAGSDMVVSAAVGVPTSDKLTTIKYDGTDMTEVESFQLGDSRGCYLYYLAIGTGPGSAKNVVVVGSSDAWQMALSTYTGVDQTTPLDTSGANRSVGPTIPSLDVSITTTVDDCWAVTSLRSGLATTNGTNTVVRRTANGLGLSDTNGSLGTAGAKTINIGQNVANAAGTGAIAVALKPATGGGGPTANLSARRQHLMMM